MKKITIIAGNWKMNKTPKEGKLLSKEIVNSLKGVNSVQVIFSPPFTGLNEIKTSAPFFKAAQNCHYEKSGPFTGEISIDMIKSCGATHVIVGHSERRKIFKEDNQTINRKVLAVKDSGLIPIFCIGETLKDRNNGLTEKIISTQITEGLDGVDSLDGLIIAYEPVWAIGTGVAANAGQIKEIHKFIQNVLKNIDKKHYTPVLYGGSVKPGNSQELINVPGVDGFLIGGASLDVDSFVSIANVMEKNRSN